MKTFEVKSPLKLDGNRYAIGDQVEIGETKLAKQLEAAGVIGGAAAKVSEPAAPTDEAERLAAIKDAVAKLEPGDFTSGNDPKPKVDAVSNLLGWDTSRAEITKATAQ